MQAVQIAGPSRSHVSSQVVSTVLKPRQTFSTCESDGYRWKLLWIYNCVLYINPISGSYAPLLIRIVRGPVFCRFRNFCPFGSALIVVKADSFTGGGGKGAPIAMMILIVVTSPRHPNTS